jgi:hypothetical protein
MIYSQLAYGRKAAVFEELEAGFDVENLFWYLFRRTGFGMIRRLDKLFDHTGIRRFNNPIAGGLRGKSL